MRQIGSILTPGAEFVRQCDASPCEECPSTQLFEGLPIIMGAARFSESFED
jgi:hypothetical protein